MGEKRARRIAGRGLINALKDQGIIDKDDNVLSVEITAHFEDEAGVALMDALEAAGIIGPVKNMQSVVIEAPFNGIARIHTRQIADERLLDVPLTGIVVETVGPSAHSAIQVTRTIFRLD